MSVAAMGEDQDVGPLACFTYFAMRVAAMGEDQDVGPFK